MERRVANVGHRAGRIPPPHLNWFFGYYGNNNEDMARATRFITNHGPTGGFRARFALEGRVEEGLSLEAKGKISRAYDERLYAATMTKVTTWKEFRKASPHVPTCQFSMGRGSVRK